MVLDLESQIISDDPTAALRRSRRPVTLKFEDVVYRIKKKPSKKSPPLAGEDGRKTILNGVSGVVFPGEMLAMLGPSGGGKTTLLTALAGRLAGDLSGEISYNGRRKPLRRETGFVSQDDVLYPHLTVGETLYYAALLRLPGSLSRRERAAEAEAVTAQLGLSSCRDGLIGGEGVRGVSGGERKRVSIGEELLVNPSLMFLDEPTSGLDSTTAQRIVATLAELTAAGRTVVMTIHQPSSRLFHMFHKILLLSDGNPIYFGKGADAIAYFADVGYSHPPSLAMNPADFLLDLANGLASGDDYENCEATKQALSTSYASNIKPKIKEQLREATEKATTWVEETKNKENDDSSSTTWWEQFTVLLERDLKERRHEAFSPFKTVQVLVIAVLCSVLWWHSSGRVQDQVGLLFFLVGFWGFFAMLNAIFTFPQERMMLTRERSSGTYRLSSYFAARMVGDLPMDLALPTVFTVIVYWTTGLRPSAGGFLFALSVFLLNVLVASGIGLAIGAIFMNPKTASTLGSVLMLASLILGGFYVDKVPTFVGWTKYASFIYHSFKLSLASQFSVDQTYRCAVGLCFVRNLPPVATVGLTDMEWSAGFSIGMVVFYRLVAYLALTKIGRVGGGGRS